MKSQLITLEMTDKDNCEMNLATTSAELTVETFLAQKQLETGDKQVLSIRT